MKLDMGLCSHMMSIGCLGEVTGYNINATVTIKTKYTITDRRMGCGQLGVEKPIFNQNDCRPKM